MYLRPAGLIASHEGWLLWEGTTRPPDRAVRRGLSRWTGQDWRRNTSWTAERRVFGSIPAGAVPDSLDEAYRPGAARPRAARPLGRPCHRLQGRGDERGRTSSCCRSNAPFFGRLLSNSSFPSPAVLRSGEFTVRCVEAEFGVEIGGDVPPGDRPYTRESVAEFIAAVIPSIEVVDHRFADWASIGTASLVADNAIHGAWIEGQPVGQWRGAGPGLTQGYAVRERPSRERQGPTAVLGHPLNVVAWLASELPRHGRHLRCGTGCDRDRGVCLLREPGRSCDRRLRVIRASGTRLECVIPWPSSSATSAPVPWWCRCGGR